MGQQPPESPPPPKPQQFDIEARLEVAEGVYANLAGVRTSPYEICIDFANIDWNSNEGALVARVSMSPMLAEQLLTALSSQIDAFAQNAIEQEVGDGSSNKPETDEGDGNEGE
jgi:hypothetical protein